MVGIPGDAPQKGCPANSEFRTGYRDKSPQDTTRGLELRFLPIMYDFIPEFFAGYARSIVKKGAEGIPSGRREGQKSRTTENGAKPAAGNSRQGSEKRAERKKRSAPCGIIRPRRSGGQRSGHRYPIGVSCGRQPGKDCTAAGNYTGITEERVCGGRGQPKVPGNSRE